MNIVLCGFMGCGKTTVGKLLAKNTGRNFIDTDEMIEKEQGVSIAEIFSEHGEEYFRELEFEACKALAKIDFAVISTGGGAMTFERNVCALKENSKIVFINTSFDVICARIAGGETRPLFKDKKKAKQLFEERKSKYEKAADYTVDGDFSPELTALKIAKLFQ